MDRDLLVDTQEFTPTWDTGELEAQPEPRRREPVGAVARACPAGGRAERLPVRQALALRARRGVRVGDRRRAGYGLYHWWYHSIDKTAPVFVVLVFLILCTVAGLLVAMVPNRPVASARGHRVHVGSAGRDRGRRRAARPLLLRMGQLAVSWGSFLTKVGV